MSWLESTWLKRLLPRGLFPGRRPGLDWITDRLWRLLRLLLVNECELIEESLQIPLLVNLCLALRLHLDKRLKTT